MQINKLNTMFYIRIKRTSDRRSNTISQIQTLTDIGTIIDYRSRNIPAAFSHNSCVPSLLPEEVPHWVFACRKGEGTGHD